MIEEKKLFGFFKNEVKRNLKEKFYYGPDFSIVLGEYSSHILWFPAGQNLFFLGEPEKSQKKKGKSDVLKFF